MGIIMYTLLCGKFPFDYSYQGDFNKILKGEVKFDMYSQFNYVSKEAKDLIVSMLNPDPKKRLSAVEVLNQPWFNLFDDFQEGKKIAKNDDIYFQLLNETRIYNENLFDNELQEQEEDFILNNIKKFKLISQDYFYDVFEVKEKNSEKKFLAKSFYVNLDDYPTKKRNKILKIMKKILELNHPSILKSIHFSQTGFDQEIRPTLFTEFNSNISLAETILNGHLNPTKKLINIYGIACGMSYLHSNNILHLNLTPRNIIEDSYFYPKIKDFGINGILKNLETLAKIHVCSPYTAPEVYINNEYTEKSEVFSFALIVWAIMNNELPFDGIKKIEILNVIQNDIKLKMNENVDEVYRELIRKCWSKDPNKRPNFSQIVDEIENKREFITKDVSEYEFRKYIEIIKQDTFKQTTKSHNNQRKTENSNKRKDENKGSKERNQKESDHHNKKEKTNKDKKEGDDHNKKEKPNKDKKESDDDDDNDEEEEEEDLNIQIDFDDDEEEEEEEDYNKWKKFIKEKGMKKDNDLDIIPVLVDINDIPLLTPDLFLKIEEYERGPTIEYGSIGKVVVAKYLPENLLRAAKIYGVNVRDNKKDKKISEIIEQLKINVKNDIQYHLIFSGPKVNPSTYHPSICKLIGYSSVNFKNIDNSLKMLELYKNGSLKNIVKNGKKIKKWNDTKKLINIYGIASSMAHLHSNGFIFRDLKLANILVDDSFYPMLNDFDLAIKISELKNLKEKNPKGTIQYAAPEILSNCKYSKASDVYAFGILVYEIITGKRVFENNSYENILFLLQIKKVRPEFDTEINDCYKKLIESCWDEDPEKRPTFDNILFNLQENKEFLKNVDIIEYENYQKQLFNKL